MCYVCADYSITADCVWPRRSSLSFRAELLCDFLLVKKKRTPFLPPQTRVTACSHTDRHLSSSLQVSHSARVWKNDRNMARRKMKRSVHEHLEEGRYGRRDFRPRWGHLHTLLFSSSFLSVPVTFTRRPQRTWWMESETGERTKMRAGEADEKWQTPKRKTARETEQVNLNNRQEREREGEYETRKERVQGVMRWEDEGERAEAKDWGWKRRYIEREWRWLRRWRVNLGEAAWWVMMTAAR